MSLDPSFGPQNETSAEILLEKTFLQAGYLTGIGFGIQFVLYIACVRILLTRSPSPTRTFMISYLTLLCALNGMWTALSTYGLQTTFIDNRNIPGGPLAYLAVEFAEPFNIAANAAYISSNILADGLLLWRCNVIWSASHRGNIRILVMTLPVLLILASTSIGIVYAVETASPEGLYGETTFLFALPYFSLSLALNIVLTALIGGRIWTHKKSIANVLGSDYAKQYTSITTIFVESAMLYAITSILLVSTFATGNAINQIWLGIAPAVQLISNYLIIYRVADGSAWNSRVFSSKANHSTSVAATIAFRKPGVSASESTAARSTMGSSGDIPLEYIDQKGAKGVWVTKSITTDGDTRSGTRFESYDHEGDSDESKAEHV